MHSEIQETGAWPQSVEWTQRKAEPFLTPGGEAATVLPPSGKREQATLPDPETFEIEELKCVAIAWTQTNRLRY